MGDDRTLNEKHSLDEIKKVIQDTDTVHVSTIAGDSIRSRMMHFGLDESFNIYLASMKGDPKFLQISGNRNITLLFHKTALDESESAEIEIIGMAEIVKDENERQKGLTLEAPKSSIVRNLIESGNTRLLDCIKVKPFQIKYRVFKEITQGVPPTIYNFPQNFEPESDSTKIMRKAKIWITELRLPFLTGSVMPLILGAMVAFSQDGLFHWGLFFLALVGGILIHLGANVFNDYFDHKSRNDEVNKEFVRPFSGGSRMIQLGLLSPTEVFSGATILFIGAMAIGFVLTWIRGWPILIFGAIGLLSGFFYTAPPLNLASRGIGEFFVGLNFSVLMTLGSYYVQTASFSWTALVASIPMALLIATVLYVNEFPDYRADKAVGKRHLVVRMGRKKAMLGMPILFIATYATIVLGVIFSLLPIYTLIALFSLPFAIKATRYCMKFYSSSFEMVPANAATILTHMFTGILLIGGFGFTRLETVGVGYVALFTILFAVIIGFVYWTTGKKEAAMAGIKKTTA